MRSNKILSVATALLAIMVAASAGTVLVANLLFRRNIERKVTKLFAAGAMAEPAMVTEVDLAGLPEPVQRWMRRANVVGKPRATAVRLRQTGRIRENPEDDWMELDAVEYYTVDPPAFLWHGSVKPMGVVQAVDAYVQGRGGLNVTLLSLFPMDSSTGATADQGSALRYLNETMWFPSAALSEKISWEAVDANSARATLSDHGQRVSAIFYFNDEGDVIDCVAERYRGEDELLTWSTPLSAHGEFDGVRVPTMGQGVWHPESGEFAYIELEIADVEYNVAAPY